MVLCDADMLVLFMSLCRMVNIRKVDSYSNHESTQKIRSLEMEDLISRQAAIACKTTFTNDNDEKTAFQRKVAKVHNAQLKAPCIPLENGGILMSFLCA